MRYQEMMKMMILAILDLGKALREFKEEKPSIVESKIILIFV